MEEEEGDDFLKVLRALRDAARTVESGGSSSVPALHALLALEASADDLLAGDPDLRALRRLLARIRALSWRAEPSSSQADGTGVVGEVRARCRRCKARRGIARAAGEVASEIQAWADRELAARLVAALRRGGERSDARARALLAELESRLAAEGRFDARLQDAVLRHGVFAAVEARLTDPAVGDGCAAAVLALVRFNRDVFVGPVLMGPAVGALVSAAASSSSSSAAPLRALNGLVDAIRTPLVDELHGRGELPRLVSLLCAAAPRVRALAVELVLRVAYYGRWEVLEALLAEGLVKRLLCLQRSDDDRLGAGAGGSATDTDGEDTALSASRRPFVSAVARFAVQVEVGQGLGPRERRLAKLDILRRVREAAVSPAEEATVLAEVLWGATP
jgi:hypothetical protein